MKLDRDLVRQVASLARLELPEDRLDALAAELSAILDYADQLGLIPDPGADPNEGILPRRADLPEASAGQRLVALAADHVGDEVRVPTVVGEAP